MGIFLRLLCLAQDSLEMGMLLATTSPEKSIQVTLGLFWTCVGWGNPKEAVEASGGLGVNCSFDPDWLQAG